MNVFTGPHTHTPTDAFQAWLTMLWSPLSPPPGGNSGTVRSLPLIPQPAVVWKLAFHWGLLECLAQHSSPKIFYNHTRAPLTANWMSNICGNMDFFFIFFYGWVCNVGVCSEGWGGQLLPGEVMCYFQSIVSTSCRSGVIGVGCCRLYGVKRRGGKSAA